MEEVRDPRLHEIDRKIQAGERLTFDDGVVLYQTADLEGLGALANRECVKKNGNRAQFVMNRHLNYSNVCAETCLFCAFGKRLGQKGGYEFSLDDIWERTRDLEEEGITELHIVGGLHPTFPFSYYTDMLAGLKQRHPRVTLKAFTAVEIEHLSRMADLPMRDTLIQLKNAGLQALTGGGAEIFAERARKKICRTKVDGDLWIEIHRLAHSLGLYSNSTMLYGHVETIEERVDHILRIRSLQDETGRFLTFIPLAFHPENTFLSHIPKATDDDHLRSIAVSRLLLDNFQHIKCYWIMSGVEVAQRSLHFGADDLDGTVKEEKIYHMAGSRTPQELKREFLIGLIRDTGRLPVERDSFYNPIWIDRSIDEGSGRIYANA